MLLRIIAFAAVLLTGMAGAVAKDKVTIAVASHGFLYVPAFVASELGYFAEEGIEPEFVLINSGAKMIAAVLGGNVHLCISTPAAAFRAREKGQDALVIGSDVTQFAIDVVITKDWAKKTGVTSASPYDQKLAALKGIQIGISSAGSGTDQLVRFLAKEAGLNADREMTIVPVGSHETGLASFATGRIDGYATSQPGGDKAIREMGGTMLFNLSRGEVKAFDGFLFNAVIARQSWAEQNPDLTVRFLRGMQKALNALHDSALTVKARDAIHAKYQNKMAKDEYDRLWTEMLLSYPKTITLDEPMMRRVADFVGAFEKNPIDPATFGTAWTNSYAEKALAGMRR